MDRTPECGTKQGTAEEVVKSYQNRGYRKIQDLTIAKEVPEVLEAFPTDRSSCQVLFQHDVDNAASLNTSPYILVCPSEGGELPETAPGAPRNLTATPGDGEVTLTWDPPLSDGGTPIIRYEYQVDEGAWSETDGASPTRYRRLDQRHAVPVRGVRAINSANEPEPGPGSTSAQVSASPSSEPVEPVEVDPVEQEAVTETVQAVAAATVANIAANIGTRFSASGSGGTVVVGGQDGHRRAGSGIGLQPGRRFPPPGRPLQGGRRLRACTEPRPRRPAADQRVRGLPQRRGRGSAGWRHGHPVDCLGPRRPPALREQARARVDLRRRPEVGLFRRRRPEGRPVALRGWRRRRRERSPTTVWAAAAETAGWRCG